MKSYSKTFTYSLFEKEFHVAKAVSLLNESKRDVPKEALQIHMINIEKTINIPTKKMVLSDYNAGYIVPYIVTGTIELPATIPILLTKTKDSSMYQAIINITSYCSIEKDTLGNIVDVKIDDKKLFTLLQTACIYRRWAMDDTKVSINNSFIKTAANMYAKLMYKVLDKKYAVGSIYDSIDKCHAALAYFFASYFVDSKYAKDIACNIPTLVDKRVALEYMSSIKVTSFNGFEDLILMLRDSIRGLSKLDTMHFISGFAEIWNGSAVPAIDYFPYFVHMISSAYVGANLVKDLLINSVIRTDGEDFMQGLVNIYGK